MKLNTHLVLFTNLVKEEYFVQTACMKEREDILSIMSLLVLLSFNTVLLVG